MLKQVIFMFVLLAALTAHSICDVSVDPNDANSIFMAQLRVQQQHTDLLKAQIDQQREQLALLQDMVYHQTSIWRDIIAPVLSALFYSATVAILAIIYRNLSLKIVANKLGMPHFDPEWEISSERSGAIGLSPSRSQMSKLIDIESGYQRARQDAEASHDGYFSAAE